MGRNRREDNARRTLRPGKQEDAADDCPAAPRDDTESAAMGRPRHRAVCHVVDGGLRRGPHEQRN